MKKILSSNFLMLLLMILATAATAQNDVTNDFDRPADNDQPPRQERLAEFLGLSAEQIAQIQMIRREQAPLMRDARIRQREARSKLDEVIYADQFDEMTVQLHLRQFLEAQAEVTRLRLMNELTLRRILTPEQLVKFRNVRERMKKRAQRQQNRRNLRRNRPNRRPLQPRF